jgi:adenylylsulfate kinase-like enzyme
LFADAGIIAIVALISPFIKDRLRARALISSDSFIEVHLSTSLTVCEQRDPKGLYLKARRGQLPHFTGIDDPYEVPISPDLRLDTALLGPDACIDEVMRIITQAGLISSR